VSDPKPQDRRWNWKVFLSTAVAGLFTFAGAAFLTIVLREASVVAAPAPAPVSLARAATPLVQPSAADGFPNSPAPGMTPVVAAAVPQERLSGSVMHNPFAALNAGTPITAAVAASAPAATQHKTPKPEPKPVMLPALPPGPPPVPTAPPLPFVAVGSIQGTQVTNGQPVAFIRQQDQLIVVRAGDAVGQSYKVESISPKAIEFTYLPLMQRQTLALAP
jgi:hypothetical protein